MGKKELRGSSESITFDEAKEMADCKMTELLGYIVSIVDELPDDKCNEEERANLKTNIAVKMGELAAFNVLKGVLMDPKEYISSLPYGETAQVVEM